MVTNRHCIIARLSRREEYQCDLTFPSFRLFIFGLAIIPLGLALARGLGLYAIVSEREAQVYTLFGKVIGTIDEPGLRFPWPHFGLRALLVPFFGKRDTGRARRCGSITCATRWSTRRRARRWAWASGTRCR